MLPTIMNKGSINMTSVIAIIVLIGAAIVWYVAVYQKEQPQPLSPVQPMPSTDSRYNNRPL